MTAHSGADGDGNGMVDDADYQVWSNNFGATSPGSGAGARAGSAAVPEPSALVLLSYGLTVILAKVRRRKVRG